MTAQPGREAAAPDQQPFLVTAQPGSRLADLLDRHDMAKARAEEAKALADSLAAAIKNELTAACQGRTVVDIDAPGRQRQRLAWRTPRKFSTEQFRRTHPGLYQSFLVWGTPYWELRTLKGSGS